MGLPIVRVGLEPVRNWLVVSCGLLLRVMLLWTITEPPWFHGCLGITGGVGATLGGPTPPIWGWLIP